MKAITLVALSAVMLTGCYSRQTFAKKALKQGTPIFGICREYLEKDTTLPEERRELRLQTITEFEEFLKEGARGK